jgi:CheY-like chemotaxis protein
MKDILIVEDGAKERERLTRLFSEAGYTVAAFESVGEAEQSAEREQYRLAILDIGLNDRSGSYLFDRLKRHRTPPQVIIFTGNPSVHLKQRFLGEGAVDYIVKASPQSHGDQFLTRVKELIGPSGVKEVLGIELLEFLERYLPPTSRPLFLTMDNQCPKCRQCGQDRYVVTFAQQPQIPPTLTAVVVCGGCGTPLDPAVE